jgi:uncharacterized protein (TIGR02646 family)
LKSGKRWLRIIGTPHSDELRGAEKHALHESLLVEQGWVCCYCGRSVDVENSHIEHFRPQNHYEGLSLDYGNLHASCYKMPAREAVHCGHFKSDRFDDELHISPLDAECERRFLYMANGDVTSSDPQDLSARYMQDILGLNTPFLRNAREEVLKVFDPEFMATTTPEELERLCAGVRARDVEGRLSGYGHVVACFAEQYASRSPETQERSTLE